MEGISELYRLSSVSDLVGGFVKARYIVLMTIGLWLVVTIVYCYFWVTSILARPDTVGYERWVMLPILGFIVYRLPYLVVGLVLVISGELILLAAARRNVKNPSHRNEPHTS